jgi:SulP family sulfate permease
MLFMRRMAELTEGHIHLESSGEETGRARLPTGVALYEIEGPLFFGAAQNAMRTLSNLRGEGLKVLVLALGEVPTIDATGLVALEGAISNLRKNKTAVVLAGPLPEPQRLFEDAALRQKHPGLEIAPTLEQALELAAAIAAGERDNVAMLGAVLPGSVRHV